MRKSINKRTRLLVLLVAAQMVVVGCTKKQETQQPPPTPKPVSKPAAQVQMQASSAKTALPGNVLLDFSNKKDPFKPFVSAQPAKVQPRPSGVVRSGEILPIQSYDVNKFRVSGIITGLKENTALVLDPAGRGYVVREGMIIGSNDGKIKRITPSAIEVVEQYRDDNGRLRKRSVILSLAKKK